LDEEQSKHVIWTSIFAQFAEARKMLDSLIGMVVFKRTLYHNWAGMKLFLKIRDWFLH
jgi:hypothetical protein